MSLNWNSSSLPLLSKRIVRLTAINCPWAFGVSEKFWNTANWIYAWKTYPNMIAFEHCTRNVGVTSVWETLQLCDVNKNWRTAWEQRFVPSPYLTLNTFFFFFSHHSSWMTLWNCNAERGDKLPGVNTCREVGLSWVGRSGRRWLGLQVPSAVSLQSLHTAAGTWHGFNIPH